MAGQSYIGTSGWNYKRWRNGFYGDTPQKQWLRFCAERFTAIEANGTFYRLQEKSTYARWRDETPDVVYIRLHGHTRKYASSYSGRALRKWAARIQRWLRENRDVHVYFDNDAEGAAPRNALTLLEMLR